MSSSNRNSDDNKVYVLVVQGKFAGKAMGLSLG